MKCKRSTDSRSITIARKFPFHTTFLRVDNDSAQTSEQTFSLIQSTIVLSMHKFNLAKLPFSNNHALIMYHLYVCHCLWQFSYSCFNLIIYKKLFLTMCLQLNKSRPDPGHQCPPTSSNSSRTTYRLATVDCPRLPETIAPRMRWIADPSWNQSTCHSRGELLRP